MPNRKKAPIIKSIDSLTLPDCQVHHLSNGIPVYEVNMGTQEIIKLEVVFRTGRPQEHKALIARATSRLLKEGTTTLNSAEIAEKIDFYGGAINTPINLDISSVILYSLNKHFEKLLVLLGDILANPIFPERELDTFINNNVQQLKLNLNKVDVIAYREITERIFGAEHPYGYNSTEEMYKAINRDDLVKHFKEQYIREQCFIIISGKLNDSSIDLLEKHLGQVIQSGTASKIILPSDLPSPQHIFKTHPQALQSSIRIGCKLFNRHHEDYKDIFILNTVLGGYFGSRLMANIREEKGYTYNIFSTLDTMIHDGYFYIGTEVGNEHVKETLQEIYKECVLLQNELVDDEELEMVKNYLLGNMLTMLDGPMNVSEVIKTMVSDEIPFSDFGALENSIKQISSEQIRTLAQKYLSPKDMWQIVIGQ